MKDIAEYIEAFYNRMRRHSHIGGVSPEVFEAADYVGVVSTKSWELQGSTAILVGSAHDLPEMSQTYACALTRLRRVLVTLT